MTTPDGFLPVALPPDAARSAQVKNAGTASITGVLPYTRLKALAIQAANSTGPVNGRVYDWIVSSNGVTILQGTCNGNGMPEFTLSGVNIELTPNSVFLAEVSTPAIGSETISVNVVLGY